MTVESGQFARRARRRSSGAGFRMGAAWRRVGPLPVLFVLLVATLVLFGGSSRYDQLAQVPVRLAAILLLAVAGVRAGGASERELRFPAAWLSIATALVCVQLIPLPPSLWASLPGRMALADGATIAGVAQAWHPIALAPDLTVNSLLSLTVPLATFVALVRLDPSYQRWITPVVLLVALASLLVGSIQLATGAESLSVVYQMQWHGTAPGIFANRNHHAVMLAMSLPLLAGWEGLRRGDHRGTLYRWAAAGMALLVIIDIVITGSRSGLLVGAVGLLSAAAIVRGWYPRRSSALVRRRWAVLVGAALLTVVLVVAAIVLGRAQAIDRLLAADPMGDKRARALPAVIDVLWRYFPVGTGFGGFDVAFRRDEPFNLLETTYFNQAHDDLIQVILEGGVAGLVLLLAALSWLARAGARAWRARGADQSVARARAAVSALLLVAVASAVDYPLRTPTMMAVVAALVFQLTVALAERKRSKDQNDLALRNDRPSL